MGLFDSVTHSFATAGTGGFGIKADSIAGYNTYCQIVIGVFMILFGVNFNFYYLICSFKSKIAFSNFSFSSAIFCFCIDKPKLNAQPQCLYWICLYNIANHVCNPSSDTHQTMKFFLHDIFFCDF